MSSNLEASGRLYPIIPISESGQVISSRSLTSVAADDDSKSKNDEVEVILDTNQLIDVTTTLPPEKNSDKMNGTTLTAIAGSKPSPTSGPGSPPRRSSAIPTPLLQSSFANGGDTLGEPESVMFRSSRDGRSVASTEMKDQEQQPSPSGPGDNNDVPPLVSLSTELLENSVRNSPRGKRKSAIKSSKRDVTKLSPRSVRSSVRLPSYRDDGGKTVGTDVKEQPSVASANVNPDDNNEFPELLSLSTQLLENSVMNSPRNMHRKSASKKKSKRDLKLSPRSVRGSMRLPPYRPTKRIVTTTRGGRQGPQLRRHTTAPGAFRGISGGDGSLTTSRHAALRRFQSDVISTTDFPVHDDSYLLSGSNGSVGSGGENLPGAYRVDAEDAGEDGEVNTDPLEPPPPVGAGQSERSVSFDLDENRSGGEASTNQPSTEREPSEDLDAAEDGAAGVAPVSAVTLGTGRSWTNRPRGDGASQVSWGWSLSGPKKGEKETRWYCTPKFKVAAFVMLVVVVVAVAVPVALSGGGGGGGDTTSQDQKTSGSTPSSSDNAAPIILEKVLTISDKADLNDPDSAQAWALDWITYADNFDVHNSQDFQLLQRYVLVVLYYSTGREDMLDPDRGECDWDGVGCFADKSQVNIREIVFSDRHKRNNDNRDRLIPPELSYLEKLETLNFTDSGITNFPIDTFTQLTGLKSLDLSDNEIKMHIPSGLYDMGSLETLILSYNKFTGPISPLISNLGALRDLRLMRNELEGEIPKEFMSLPHLEILVLNDNLLNGNITELFPAVPSLKALGLANNAFTGQIPTEIGSLVNLEEVWFNHNIFMDSTLPTEIGNMRQLKDALFYNCGLRGEVPSEFGNLTNLVLLNLGSNDLNSKLPTELGNLKLLEELHVLHNDFTNTIPSELGKLSNLQYLSLQVNLLKGNVPEEVCNLTTGELHFFGFDCTVNCSCCGSHLCTPLPPGFSD